MNSELGGETENLGFRDPPDYITDPCLIYLARTSELRAFIGSYYGPAEQSAEGDQHPVVGDTPASDEQAPKAPDRKSLHDHIVAEIILSRTVETFDLYMSMILRDIFFAKPEILSSDEKTDIETIIQSGSYEELIYRIVERKVHELSYKSLKDLRRFILSRTGVELFLQDDIFDMVLVASEVRNLIAHNDRVVNEVFKVKTKGAKYVPGITSLSKVDLTPEWVLRASFVIHGVVFNFDQAVSSKFNLSTRLRFASFIVRG